MSFKSMFKKSAIIAAGISSTMSIAQAKLQYNVGLGLGMGLLEFNGDKKDSSFVGDINFLGLPAGTGYEHGVAMRTSYKYLGNLPQKVLNFEGGVTKQFENISVMDRSFFAGAILGFGWGRTHAAEGLLNPKANYFNTGSTSLFFSLNGKFGLENKGSKIYGLAGLSMVQTDLPYDILPGGYYPGSPDIITCTTLKPGDLVDSLTSIAGPAELALLNTLNNACSNIKVDDASYNAWFVNLGAGMEVNVTEKLTLFAEYTHMFQLNKGKTHSINYSVNNAQGTFKGKIKTTNIDYLKAGVRYYFN